MIRVLTRPGRLKYNEATAPAARLALMLTYGYNRNKLLLALSKGKLKNLKKSAYQRIYSSQLDTFIETEQKPKCKNNNFVFFTGSYMASFIACRISPGSYWSLKYNSPLLSMKLK